MGLTVRKRKAPAQGHPFLFSGLRSLWLSPNLRYAAAYNPIRREFIAYDTSYVSNREPMGRIIAYSATLRGLAFRLKLLGHHIERKETSLAQAFSSINRYWSPRNNQE